MNLERAGVENRVKADQMRAEGHTYKEIAQAFGVSQQRIQQWLRPPEAICQVLLKRSNGLCEECGIRLRRGEGSIHHRNHPGNSPEHLQFLCRFCHRKAHIEFDSKTYQPAPTPNCMTPTEIRSLRKSLGLTQKDMAKQVGVNIFTVRRWETGKAKPLPFFRMKLQTLTNR